MQNIKLYVMTLLSINPFLFVQINLQSFLTVHAVNKTKKRNAPFYVYTSYRGRSELLAA